MARLTIRNLENLDDEVKEGLRVQAASNSRSMEAEARALLTLVVKEAPLEAEALALWWRRRRKAEVDLARSPPSRTRRRTK